VKQSSVFLSICAIILCSILWSNKASATHAAGGELLYEWVSDSTYKLIFKFYRDCAGSAPEPATVSVCYLNECTGFVGAVALPKKGGANGNEVGTGCPGYPTKCASTSNTLPGYREWIYEANVTLPSRCTTWRFFTSISARNNAITNLVSPGSQTLYIEATLNNVVAQGNSSPQFTVAPVPYVCINMPYAFNNGAVDINGDVMRFQNIRPRNGGSSCVPFPAINDIGYTSGFSLPSNPFATGNTFSLDSMTGEMTFTPTAVQIAVVSIRVKEYRNGVEIGSVMRDIQIIVRSDCSTAPQVAEPDGSSVVNGEYTGSRIEGCANTPLSFCVDLKSPVDPDAILVATSNHAQALPGSILDVQNQRTDSVRACIFWTPGLADTGLHVLFFTVKDSTCRPPGLLVSQTFTVPVYIWPPTEAFPDTAICPGDSVQLIARGWPSFTWTVLPGGDPVSSLSCTDCPDPVGRPMSTTRYVLTSDNLICAKSRDTVTVIALDAPEIQVTPDTTTCVGSELQLNVSVNNQPPGSYNVLWTPATGLSDATSNTPIATPTQDMIYEARVTMKNGGCSMWDTVRVTVLQGYDLLTPDTAICLGDTVRVRLVGDARYQYSWTPALGVSNTSIMQPQIVADSSRTYMVTASYPGCRDSVRTLTVDVQPVPEVDLGPDQILCYGDTFRLLPNIIPPDYAYYSYSWNPGGGLDPGPNVANPLFTAATTTTFTVVVSTPAGCQGTDDILLNVVAPDIIQATPDTAICPGDTIQLHVWGSQVSQVWRPAYYISDTSDADPWVFPVNSVTYTVYGRDKDNCLDTQTVHVRVLPAAVVELPDSARIYPGESYQMEPGGNCLYFEWFPPLGLSDHKLRNPVAMPEVDTRYFLTGWTEFGCAATDSMDLYVNLDSYVDVPNAFVPGGGRKLRPVRNGIIQVNSFSIYNRWGIKMFETSNMDDGWDGTFNGEPQPMGVYVYVVEAVTPAGRVFNKQGNVTLLR
jgi:gliding motility-associated-like protein